MGWIPLLGLVVAMALLLLSERWIHRHLQGTMLLLTGDQEIAVVLYALPLMPGILLHELSHALVAKLLGVKVGRVSIRPQLANQRIQLGFVPVEETDVVRASLIGLAPLLIGNAVTLLIGYCIFEIGAMEGAFAEGDWTELIPGLMEMLKAPDVWIWAYVIFAVSNTMLPSRADRQSWKPVLLFLLLLGALVWVVGLGTELVESVAQPLIVAIRWLTAIYIFTIMIDLPFILLIMIGERLIGHIRGMRVEY